MSTESLKRLSDYFAEIVLNKIKSKSKGQLLLSKARIKIFQETLSTLNVLQDAVEQDVIVETSLLNYVDKTYFDRLESMATDWNSQEDHMKCCYAEFSLNSNNNIWMLLYRIKIKELEMLFKCEVNADEVIDYQLRIARGDCENYWDYYFTYANQNLSVI